MRRILVTAILLAGLGGFALLAGGAKDDGNKAPQYWVELDNAFGLIPGADFKVAGVRAGKLGEMKVDPRSHKALVSFTITERGFSPLKTDVFCESRPQSLIGEYFIDCNPGRSDTVLRPGSTIPVTHTFSTIPADLVNNILRLPQRERLRIILNELGVSLAARGDDLNVALRRAVPALFETDRLLKLLADENQTITELTVNADRVITTFANNRGEITRFVREARDTSVASAQRRVALAQTFRLLPAFLRELGPTMVELGRVADQQIPTLRDLDAASGNLKRFLDDLGPFSQASQPSLESLGQTSLIGRRTIPPAQKTVGELKQFSPEVPELARNLAIVLSDLFDRGRAVEPDPRSPGGKGFNGFEALLRYAYTQSQAINIFDRNGYILKVAVFRIGECSDYRDQSVASEQAVLDKCASALGPTQPGINAPDPTSPATAPHGASLSSAQSNNRRNNQRDADVLSAAEAAAGPAPQPGADSQSASGSGRRGKHGRRNGNADGSGDGDQPGPIDLPSTLRTLMGGSSGQAGTPAASTQPARDQSATELLDYLFAP